MEFNQCFFFGKTTEILGKMNFFKKKISVDFFLPRKIHSHFSYTNKLKKSPIIFWTYLPYLPRKLESKFFTEKNLIETFTKKKSTEMFYRIKLAETFYQEKWTEIFSEEKLTEIFSEEKLTDILYFTEKTWIEFFYREKLDQGFLPRKNGPRFLPKKKMNEMFYREKLTEIFYHILKPKTFTVKNWRIHFTEKNLTQILTEKM